MLLVYVFFLCQATFFATAEENCDKSGILIYEDLGCTPEYDVDRNCPRRYSCNELERSSNSCYFRGKSYAPQEQVDRSLTSPSCDEYCVCYEGQKFECAIVECAEFFVETKPECYWNHTFDGCCGVDQICPPFNETETCEVEGKKYKIGEEFIASTSCQRCICRKGFKGKFEEPFCKRKLCGQQLKRDATSIAASCAAFYSKQFHKEALCCPDYWICPDGSETIEGEAKSDEFCKFGDNTVKVGQSFTKRNVLDDYGRNFTKVNCECVIPPLVRCIDV